MKLSAVAMASALLVAAQGVWTQDADANAVAASSSTVRNGVSTGTSARPTTQATGASAGCRAECRLRRDAIPLATSLLGAIMVLAGVVLALRSRRSSRRLGLFVATIGATAQLVAALTFAASQLS